MPNDLRAHIRYPQMLFDIQTDIYSKYHIQSAREFYNKSDVWRFLRKYSLTLVAPQVNRSWWSLIFDYEIA